MTIKACPRCGSQRIYMGTLKAGVIYGVTSWKLQCRDCGYQGQPLLFDTQEEYDKFRESLTSPSPSVVPEAEEEKPDAAIVDLLDNTKEVGEEPERKAKSWRLEIAVSIVIAAVVTILEAPGFLATMGSAALVYIFFFMVLVAVVILVVIIVLEYFYRAIRRGTTKKQE